MPNGANIPAQSLPPQPSPAGLDKRKLIIILILAIVATIIIVLLIRGLVLPPKGAAVSSGVGQPTAPAVSLPTTAPPISATAGITTWGGTLTLTDGDARLSAGGRSYDLFIKAAGQSSRILKEMDYNTGEKINVLGKLTGNYLEVAGVSK